MLSIERLWNALALGGVLFALLATAGVVNLGDFPHWLHFIITPTIPAVAAEGPGEAARVATAQPARVERQSLPESGQDPAEDDTLAAHVTVEAPTFSPTSSDPSLLAHEDTTTIPLHAMLTSHNGSTPTFRAHDEIKALLLTTTDAFAYCYYADGSGTISRIFPNRFQPDARVREGGLQLPTGGFTLVADTPNRTEELRCIAATRDLGSRLPNVLTAEDLVPLPVRSLNEISKMFQSLGEEVVETRLVAMVAP